MKDVIQTNRRFRICLTLGLAVMTGLGLYSCKKLDFTKTEIGNPQDEWLHYDNGTNYTGISANSGGAFDIAIRFSAFQIINFDGFLISKVRFFPVLGYPTEYSITIWQGSEPPVLLHVQDITVISGTWNEAVIDDFYYVDASKDLWIGVWIQNYAAGTYPAGCDAGPAVAGKGDLYSIDDGSTWYSLYTSDGLDYNWNLQVYVTDLKGRQVELGNTDDLSSPDDKLSLQKHDTGKINAGMVSLN
ncbi:MAG: hypothetical protein MUC31_00560 [Bacteroidales bacterium]|jgi:hypothetical protein|nr:hypothetical protein [Bacteroidales bacterium]